MELHDNVKNGMYNEFYLVKNNVLFRSILDNSHKFEARVIPDSLLDVTLHLEHNQSGHNGYQRTYAAIKCLLLERYAGCKFCSIAKIARFVHYKRLKKPNLKNKFSNLVCNP